MIDTVDLIEQDNFNSHTYDEYGTCVFCGAEFDDENNCCPMSPSDQEDQPPKRNIEYVWNETMKQHREGI